MRPEPTSKRDDKPIKIRIALLDPVRGKWYDGPVFYNKKEYLVAIRRLHAEGTPYYTQNLKTRFWRRGCFTHRLP